MKKIKIEGTAFSAVPFAAQNKNKHTLQAEQISIENNEDFVYKFADNQNADENKIVVFDDAKSGKKVAVGTVNGRYMECGSVAGWLKANNAVLADIVK